MFSCAILCNRRLSLFLFLFFTHIATHTHTHTHTMSSAPKSKAEAAERDTATKGVAASSSGNLVPVSVLGPLASSFTVGGVSG